MHWLRRIVAGGALGLALAYAFVVPGLYFAQRGLIYPAPQGAAQVPPGFEEVALATADGLELAAAWRPPLSGRPTLVFFHGNGDDWAGGARATARLAARGYGVLLPEYRGYASNPGQPDEPGLYRDGRAALDWLTARGIAPAGVVLVGNSIGSGVATQLAREGRGRALVLLSPFASLPDLIAEKLPWLPVRWLVRDAYDNAAKLGAVRAPVLVVHGTADTMIAPDHARRLARVNRHAKLVLLPGLDHDLAWDQGAQAVQQDWLEQVFAAQASPQASPQPIQRQIPAGT